jgi:beta-ureidopropionase / N-carbamoyl-L-amino-acid hydrolase
MVEINSTRLLDDLAALRRIGGQGTGVVREAFTATDLEGRRWLARRFAGTRSEGARCSTAHSLPPN